MTRVNAVNGAGSACCACQNNRAGSLLELKTAILSMPKVTFPEYLASDIVERLGSFRQGRACKPIWIPVVYESAREKFHQAKVPSSEDQLIGV
jgi:hypothetical protein